MKSAAVCRGLPCTDVLTFCSNPNAVDVGCGYHDVEYEDQLPKSNENAPPSLALCTNIRNVTNVFIIERGRTNRNDQSHCTRFSQKFKFGNIFHFFIFSFFLL